MSTLTDRIAAIAAAKADIKAAIEAKNPPVPPTDALASFAPAIESIVQGTPDLPVEDLPDLPVSDYEWVKPDDWPDIISIYNQNRDKEHYSNAIIWLLDADELRGGRLLGTDGALPPRSVFIPKFIASSTSASSRRIDKFLFSDGTSLEYTASNVPADTYHEFTASDKYVWVMVFSSFATRDDAPSGIYYHPASYVISTSHRDTALLQIYGDADSCQYDDGTCVNRSATLRRYDMGKLQKAGSYTFDSDYALEWVDIGTYEFHGACTTTFSYSSQLGHLRIGRISAKTTLTTNSNFSTIFGNLRNIEKIDFSMGSDVKILSAASMFANDYRLVSIPQSGVTLKPAGSAVSLFGYCYLLSRIPPWVDLSTATDVGSAYRYCFRVRQLNGSCVCAPKATAASYFVADCPSLKKVSGIEISSLCTNTSLMFSNDFDLEEIEGSIDTSKSTTCASMFASCVRLKHYDYPIDARTATTLASIFSTCYDLESVGPIYFSSKCTTIGSMFIHCRRIRSVSIPACDFTAVTTLSSVFQNCVLLEDSPFAEIRAPVATTAASMFNTCLSLKTAPSSLVLPKATSLGSAFNYCEALEVPPDVVDAGSTAAGCDASSMFSYCLNMKRSPSSINATKIKTTVSMFAYCVSMETVCAIQLGTLCTTVANMFTYCTKLRDASGVTWTKSVTTCGAVFLGCYMLERVADTLDISGCTLTTQMFSGCASLKHVPAVLDTSKATNTYDMFFACANLEELPAVLDTSKSTRVSTMFGGCTKIKKLPKTLSFISVTNASYASDAFVGMTSLEELPATFIGPQKATGAATISFLYSYSIRKDSIETFIANISNVTNGSLKRTLQFNKPLRKLFTDDEAAALASACIAKGWTLAW